MEETEKRSGRGKPRDENLRKTILDASAALLLESGYRRFTIEGVAARAGASKVTIYKWWPSKGSLALDGYIHAVTDSIAFPHTASPRADVEAQLTSVILAFTTTASGRAIVELIGAAQEDPDLKRDLVARLIQPRRELAAGAFARFLGWDLATRRNDLYAVTDQIYGAVYHRLLLGLEPLEPSFARRLIDFWVPTDN